MPVVINEFEVVADAPPSQRRSEGDGAQGDASKAPEPAAIEPVLRLIEARALRAWAH